jgi:hypothetical protein
MNPSDRASSGGGWSDAARQWMGSLIDIGRTRIDLVGVELAEERLRIARLCLGAMLTLFLLGLGILLSVGALLLWCEPAQHPQCWRPAAVPAGCGDTVGAGRPGGHAPPMSRPPGRVAARPSLDGRGDEQPPRRDPGPRRQLLVLQAGLQRLHLSATPGADAPTLNLAGAGRSRTSGRALPLVAVAVAAWRHWFGRAPR